MTTKPKTLFDAEKELILEALKRNQNNKHAAARELGCTATTIRNKLKSYGLVIVREVVQPAPSEHENEFRPFNVTLRG